MCPDAGSDADMSSEVSESTTDSEDATTELYEETDASDSSELSEDLMDETDAEDDIELEDASDVAEASENDDLQDIETTEDTDVTEESDEDEDSDETEDTDGDEESDETEDSEGIESEADAEAVREEINEKSDYSDEVTEKISSVEELEVYQKAGLKEENVDGRTCLVRDEIDMDYVDPKSGMTNQELMERGRAPYDAKTGERIELHHIGQDYDSPLAELTEDTEHGEYYSALHSKEGESWRSDSQKSNHYNNVERPGHWKARAKGG